MDSETTRTLLVGGLLGLLIGEVLTPGGQVALLLGWFAVAAVYEAHRATKHLRENTT